jgi:protein-tyrosine phosphatase
MWTANRSRPPGGPPLPSPTIDSPRILLLCTANQCRSPMAEGILRRLLADAGIPASVDSAGLYEGGAPATATAVAVLGEDGIDISGHRSRHLGTVELGAADLVIGMERRHLQEAVLLDPTIRSRCFTLPELARRAEAGGPRRAGQPLREWAASLTADRLPSELLGTDDAVADPIGGSRARYQETAELLADLLQRVVHQAWPIAASGAA